MFDPKKLKALTDGLQDMQNLGKSLVDQYSKPEILDKMTPEQKAFMEDAKSGFNMEGKSLEQQLESLQSILKNHGFTGNR